ncbi:hypothetical protein [Geodermatophilus sp. URMC 65]
MQRAREVADAVRGLRGVTVVPDPPQTLVLHLLPRTTPDAEAAAPCRTTPAPSGSPPRACEG